MLIGSRDNISDDEAAGGQYPVMLSPELVQEYDLYMENQEFNIDLQQMDMEAFIQHPNNIHLNIVIISILLFLGLTNNIVAFPVMLFR